MIRETEMWWILALHKDMNRQYVEAYDKKWEAVTGGLKSSGANLNIPIVKVSTEYKTGRMRV